MPKMYQKIEKKIFIFQIFRRRYQKRQKIGKIHMDFKKLINSLEIKLELVIDFRKIFRRVAKY